MKHQDFIDLFSLGLKPIPLIWDAETKAATSHCIAHSTITPENYTESTFGTFIKDVGAANGVALKLFSPFGCIDFDLKNTEDKDVFNKWMLHVKSVDEDILSKICIESTRNAGYHVYIKYPKLSSKQNLAREEKGEEVIAIYTGGTLSYCDPTPGYTMFHNEFNDLEELTDDEFDVLVSAAVSFDKYKPVERAASGAIVIDYPFEYEAICLQFDSECTDDVFDYMLNGIGLYSVQGFRYSKKDHFVAYLRKGSKAKYSAKAYFGRNKKKLLIFSSSIDGMPCFNDRKDKDDSSWNITPAKLVYYKNDRDWSATIEEITMIADSAGIDLIKQVPVTNQDIIPQDRLRFPYDIFPPVIKDYIESHSIQHEYLAGFALAAMSVSIGNSVTLIANEGYFVKPIVYIAVVAPPGASKSPSLKAMFKKLETVDSDAYKIYEKEKTDYKLLLAEYKNQKKGGNVKEPTQPVMSQMIIKDSTIEMVVKILSHNKSGCVILADELSGFLKRMNRYGDSDEIQKWLELWSGSPVLIQRMSREENKVENPFCSIIGGIQPGVLESLASKDNEHNGFYHRFLFVYPDPIQKPDWGNYQIPNELKERVNVLFDSILSQRYSSQYYRMSHGANELYAEWFNNKNRKYNGTKEDNIKGIIAKYQDYCLRFAIIIQVMHDDGHRQGVIMPVTMERAIRLTEYFLGNMHKAMKVLSPVTPIDKITGSKLDFYNLLPQAFTNKTAVEIAKTLKISYGNCRVILTRWSGNTDQVLSKSGEQINAKYEKLF